MSDTGIAMADLKKFPRPVAKIIHEAVNKHGVTYRLQDGGHVRLYCGDRKVIPIKIASERPAEYTVKYLIPWLEEHIDSWTRDADVKDRVETLAEVLNSEPKPVRAKAVVEEEPEKDPPESMSPELVIPKDLICRWPGCDRKTKTPSGYRMHWAGHTGEKKKHAAKGAETARLRRDQETVVAREALSALAALHGLSLGGDSKQVKELQAQVKQLTKERDDALARVALMNEAFKGLE